MKSAPRPAPAPRVWVTHNEAAEKSLSSKRTIRRWVKDGEATDNADLRIRHKTIGGVPFVHIDDIMRVRGIKDKYRDTPTFGRT